MIHHVPLHTELWDVARLYGAPVGAQLAYRGGPLMGAPKLVTIFYGEDWVAPGSTLASQINTFYDFILSSTLMDQLAEYSVPGYAIRHGSRIASHFTATPTPPPPTPAPPPAGGGCLGGLAMLPIHLTAALLRDKSVIRQDPPASLTDAQIQATIADLIASGAVPKPDPDTLYMVHLAAGLTVTQGGGTSCQVFCGYHDQAAAGFLYGVLPSPDCQGCLGGMTAFDAITSITTHELAEAITDPIPGQGWYDDSNGEIGDICAWRNRKLGQYTVQLLWSNRTNSCL